jgi:hypothetical protein
MMKLYRLPALMMIVLLCLAFGVVLAQEATEEPTAAATLPPAMDNALVPCNADAPAPCDLIATQAEDIVGVWKQFLGGPPFNAPGEMAYIRYNSDGTYHIADTIENTAQPFQMYPTGTFQFDGDLFIIDPVVGSPPPCDGVGIFQLRVLKYGDQPVALRYVPISDTCPGRSIDLSQALIWVAPGE